jgi:hypothetical protein
MRKLHPGLVPVLREELKGAVNSTVVPNVRRNIPVRSGKARDSVRAVSGGNTVYVAAGSAKAPYYGWLDFGGELKNRGRGRNKTISRPVIKGGRYIYPGIAMSGTELLDAAARAVDHVTQR